MSKPSAYEVATYKGRQADESQSPDYCGSCSIERHCAQVRDPKSWVHSSIKRWEKLGNWGAKESGMVEANITQPEISATLKAEFDALAAELGKIKADRSACWAEFKVMTRACLDAEKERDALAAECQRLREALERTEQLAGMQLELISSRAPGRFLDKAPIVRVLRRYAEIARAALAGSKEQSV